jgi:hypothetical protein
VNGDVRVGRPPTVLPVDFIVRQYLAGTSTYEIGKTLGVSDRTIGRRLAAAGVQMRKTGPIARQERAS